MTLALGLEIVKISWNRLIAVGVTKPGQSNYLRSEVGKEGPERLRWKPPVDQNWCRQLCPQRQCPFSPSYKHEDEIARRRKLGCCRVQNLKTSPITWNECEFFFEPLFSSSPRNFSFHLISSHSCTTFFFDVHTHDNLLFSLRSVWSVCGKLSSQRVPTMHKMWAFFEHRDAWNKLSPTLSLVLYFSLVLEASTVISSVIYGGMADLGVCVY
jgi:hypothetical protein